MASVCSACFVSNVKNRDKVHQRSCTNDSVFYAIQNRHESCLISAVRDDKMNVNSSRTEIGQTPLMLSAQYGLHRGLQYLLEAGANIEDVDTYGRTALLYAIIGDSEKCVTVLIKSGANISCIHRSRYFNFTPLKCAAYYGRPNIIKIFINLGVPVDENDDTNKTTPLMLATQMSHRKAVEKLLSAGADVNFQNDYGGTALSLVRTPTCADLLINAGADINMEDEFGYTPVLAVTSKGCSDLLQLFLEKGGCANCKGPDGNTPLIVSARKGLYDCINVLVQYGCDLNKTGSFSGTALAEAALQGHIYCMKLLIESGALINVDNTDSNRTISARVRSSYGEYCPKTHAISILFAAGEKLCETDSEYVPNIIKCDKTESGLKHLCRKAIRKHMLEINLHEPLFQRMAKTGLPSILVSYLLYNISL